MREEREDITDHGERVRDERDDPGSSNDGTKDPTGGAGRGEQKPVEFGAGKGPAEADKAGDPQAETGAGGYAGRDPKTDMPRLPSVPESQDDPHSHDAAPSDKTGEPPASN